MPCSVLLVVRRATQSSQTIKSLDNSIDRLTQMVYDTITADWQYNPVALNNKMDLINEIDYQNLSDVSGWEYIEKNIHLTR